MNAPSATWRFVADEWQTFSLDAASRVRYGAGETWVERDLAVGQASCTNAFFGFDPLAGTVKRCEVLEADAAPPSEGVFLADEWQAFTLATPTRVRYGAASTWIESDVPAGRGLVHQRVLRDGSARRRRQAV